MYRPTIGLEIHAELSTKTKMFCRSANDPNETRPNVNICPVCMAHPGTLPVINKDAVRHVLRIGKAIGGTCADFTEFDRKSYFYPDIPKGYQISQYIHPLVSGGLLAGVGVTRVHLEEDTARSIHRDGKSLVDFNRAGIPLMELVTEPVISDAESAGNFARELQLLLRTLKASEANLEKGEMRIEANVSVSKNVSGVESILGTKVEVKNLNSFRSVERAIAYEIDRQIALIENGGEVVQETRGWDETRDKTFHQRFKEGSADYRYFPDPDLPKLYISEVAEFQHNLLVDSLPELPWERRKRYEEMFSLKKSDISFITVTKERSDFFDSVASGLKNEIKSIQLAVNYMVTDLAGIFAEKKEDKYETINPSSFVKLIMLIERGVLSSRGAKDTLVHLVKTGEDPEDIAKTKGLIQVHDTLELEKVVDTVLHEHTKAVGEYKSGKVASLQYLIGMAMKESRGSGNPELLKSIIIKKLG